MAGFKSFLSAVGHDFGAVFGWLASPKGQTTVATVEGAATAVVTAINPAAGAVLTGIEALVNNALKRVVATETVAVAAAAQSGTGAQKSAAVVDAVAPQVSSILQDLGIKEPTADQVQAISIIVGNSLTAIVDAFPAPTPAAPPATQPAAS